jgi:hypothetical protein
MAGGGRVREERRGEGGRERTKEDHRDHREEHGIKKSFHFICEVNHFAMKSKSSEDAESVRAMDSIVDPIAHTVDVVVIHTSSKENIGESSWDNCCKVNHCKETVVERINQGGREGGRRGERNLKK